MDRRMAVRHFGVRVEQIQAKIRELPLAEKFRVVADFLDAGQSEWAREAARLAMIALAAEDGGEEHG